MTTPTPADIAGTSDIEQLRTSYHEIIAELAADTQANPEHGAEVLERAHQLLQDTLGDHGEQQRG